MSMKKSSSRKSTTTPGLEVGAFMCKSPLTVGKSQSIAFAGDLMSREKIRHLPVLHGGKLVGILSDRDLLLIQAMRVDPARVTVGEAMRHDVFSVKPEHSMEGVAAQMAQHKYGCAVVMEGRKVVGILTTTDLARAYSETLRIFNAVLRRSA